MNKTYQEVCDELRVANERVAALSAHIERMQRWIKNSSQHARILTEKPETSLARHNLLQRAESLEEEAGSHSDPAIQDSLTLSAGMLRKKAEEL